MVVLHENTDPFNDINVWANWANELARSDINFAEVAVMGTIACEYETTLDKTD